MPVLWIIGVLCSIYTIIPLGTLEHIKVWEQTTSPQPGMALFYLDLRAQCLLSSYFSGLTVYVIITENIISERGPDKH